MFAQKGAQQPKENEETGASLVGTVLCIEPCTMFVEGTSVNMVTSKSGAGLRHMASGFLREEESSENEDV